MNPSKKKPLTFGNLPEEWTSYEKSRVVIAPVAYEKTVSYGAGTSLGPKAILEASEQLEFYDEELEAEPYKIGIATLPQEEPGLWEVDSVEMLDRVYLNTKKILEDGKWPLTLGGEHSLSLAAIKAVWNKHPKLTVLQIDAHADLREEYEGNPLSHACVLRRVREFCPHVAVGIRSLCREEADLVNQEKYPVFFMHQIRQEPHWVDRVVKTLGPEVYLTFDVDGLDPSEMPATGTPEPGGLRWGETLELVRRVCETRTLVGADVVELAPKEGLHFCEFSMARWIYKLIGYRFLKEMEKAGS